MCGGNGSCGSGDSFIPAEGTSWAGYAFQTGPVPEDVSGVYVFARRKGERLEAVEIGEAVDIRIAAELVEVEADCLFWMEQGNPRLRSHVEKILVDRYMPGSAQTLYSIQGRTA